MDTSEKRNRRLLYALTDLESALWKSRRILAAESVGTCARRSTTLSPAEFLHDCRETLEAVLLGERDLESESVGHLLDAMALVDESLTTANGRAELPSDCDFRQAR